MAMALGEFIIHASCTRAVFDAITTKDTDTVYFITDTGEIYKGAIPMGSNIAVDGNSITFVTDTKNLTLLGFTAAANGQLCKKNATTGKLEWFTPTYAENNTVVTLTTRVTSLEDAVGDPATRTGIYAELDTKAPIASPTLTGVPTAPTPATADDSTKIATTAFVKANLSVMGNGTVTSIIAGTGLTGGTITNSGTIAHATSGVSAGTYKSVTVNNLGHVTAGTNPTTLSGFGITDAYTKTETDAKIAATYKAAGSVAYASLPATPSASILGNVYNITDSFTSDTRFVTGEQGKTFPAGTNVVCVLISSSYYYDILSGFIDLSAYAKTTDVNAALAGKSDATHTHSSLKSGSYVASLPTMSANGNLVVDSSYVHTDNNYTAAEKTKLAGISASANKVENSATNGNIKIDGTEAVIYTLPIGTASVAGGVKSSSAADKIAIDAAGTMSLNTVSAAKVSGTVASAAKVANALTIGSVVFDGSAAKSVPYASEDEAGILKTGAAFVMASGTMDLNSVIYRALKWNVLS